MGNANTLHVVLTCPLYVSVVLARYGQSVPTGAVKAQKFERENAQNIAKETPYHLYTRRYQLSPNTTITSSFGLMPFLMG